MPKRVIAVVPSLFDFEPIRDSLTCQGIEVYPVCSVDHALELLSELQVSVILYDSDAPDPWPTALRILRQTNPTARLILLSRLADDNLWIQVLETGGYDLLLKPFLDMEIQSVVRSALTPVSFASAAA